MAHTPLDPVDLFGFNSEVTYRNQTFHVQTENTPGESEETISTLIYLQGVLIKKITSRCHGGGPLDALHERVRRQHQSVLTRIKSGELVPPSARHDRQS